MKEKRELVFLQNWNSFSLDVDDGGQAFIYHINDEEIPEVFVRLQSWDETKHHKIFNEFFAGRNLKITIETLD